MGQRSFWVSPKWAFVSSASQNQDFLKNVYLSHNVNGMVTLLTQSDPTGVEARNGCQHGAAVRPATVSPDTMPGRVFWITGLSGAGKTTIGAALWMRLRDAGRAAVFLDGDRLRGVIADDLQHDPASRRQSAMRNARLCQMLSDQGLDVVCATISLFHEVQRWNRANIPLYQEIYLRVPIDELQRRDVKGIYAKARRGQIRNVVGMDVPAEVPETPDLVLDNHGELDAAAAVNTIWNRLAKPRRTGMASDHAAIPFGTKAETLAALASVLHTGHVLPQICFSVAAWRRDPDAVLCKIRSTAWAAECNHCSQQREDRGRRFELSGWTLSVGSGSERFRGYMLRDRESHRVVRRRRRRGRPVFPAADAQRRDDGGCRVFT